MMLRRDKIFDLRRTRRQNERQLAVTSPAWAWPASLRPQLVHPRRGPHRHLTSAPTCKPTVSVARANQSVTQRSGSRKNWPKASIASFESSRLSSAPGLPRAPARASSALTGRGAGLCALCRLAAVASKRGGEARRWRCVEQARAQQPLGTPLQELRRSLRSGTSLQYSRRGLLK